MPGLPLELKGIFPVFKYSSVNLPCRNFATAASSTLNDFMILRTCGGISLNNAGPISEALARKVSTVLEGIIAGARILVSVIVLKISFPLNWLMPITTFSWKVFLTGLVRSSNAEVQSLDSTSRASVKARSTWSLTIIPTWVRASGASRLILAILRAALASARDRRVSRPLTKRS